MRVGLLRSGVGPVVEVLGGFPWRVWWRVTVGLVWRGSDCIGGFRRRTDCAEAGRREAAE